MRQPPATHAKCAATGKPPIPYHKNIGMYRAWENTLCFMMMYNCSCVLEYQNYMLYPDSVV